MQKHLEKVIFSYLYRMFSQEDFKGDNLNRLSCIIMHQMGQHPLAKYANLSYASQKEFDNRLNEYIHHLPNDDWETVLIQEFNEIINKEIFGKSFQPSEWQCDEVVTDVQHLEKPKLERSTAENIISTESINESAVCKDI